MKKFYQLTLIILFIAIGAFSQAPATWMDNFDNNDLDTAIWKENPGIYMLTGENGALSIAVSKAAPWDGFFLRFPDKINLSEHPYASIQIKADTALNFRIYLWDENSEDTLYNQSSADVWVVPGETYYTYYFNWRGKFLHSTTIDEEEVILDMDSTDIEGFLINVEPGVDNPLYQGTLMFENVMVGEAAELSSAQAMVTSSAIGSVGATVISDIAEGTTVADLMAGITHNGDEIMIFTGGSQGKAGVPAEGTEVVESSMDIVVVLEGSNPKKYDLLVAPPALPCYYRSDFPTVDAEIEAVWETVPVIEMAQILNGPENITGPTDLSGKFRVLWDEVSLFFLVEVTDDVKITDTGFPTPYADDCVEFWFDLNNSKNSAYLPSETDEYQIMFLRDNTTLHQVDHNDLINGMDWAWRDTQSGYMFEVEMPWLTAFKWMERYGVTQPEFGQKLGFEVHVNDDDDGVDRDSNIGWFYSTDRAWTDPSTLGDMKMMEEIYVSVQEAVSSLRFRMQPNPASDQLQLISNSVISSIEVFNMNGQCVKKVQGSNVRLVNLDIANLPNSIYLISVCDLSGQYTTGKFIKE
ncbi:MAG: sugar-binding protein [Bacteroidales bacterium]